MNEHYTSDGKIIGESKMSILKIKEEHVTKERTVSHDDLKKAICLKCSPCYGAMAFANALGGSKTDAWYLCHAYTLKQLLDEAKEQNLDLKGLMCAVESQPIEETFYYKRAAGLVTEEEFKVLFNKWKEGK